MNSWISLVSEFLKWIGEWLDHHVEHCLQTWSPALTVLVMVMLVFVLGGLIYHVASKPDIVQDRRKTQSKGHKSRRTRHLNRKKARGSSSTGLRGDNVGNTFTQVVYRHIPRTPPELLCSICKLVLAKKACSYQACRNCCQGRSSSICRAHGTGELVAGELIDSACREKHVLLDVSYTNLKRCPQQLGYVGSQLTSLNLSNNRLTSLPLEIGLLLGLQELFLQYNCLEELPECIGNCDRLLELDCKNNQLHRLPSSIGHLRNLQVLNLTNNFLSELPANLGRLIFLEELCVHSNRLQAIPDTLCNLINLRDLYLGENHRLKLLPDNFGNLIRLSELDVSSCSMEYLPESLSNCTSLTKVWMSHNKLRYLPSQLGRLHQLKELHVCNNQLQYFPASMSYLQLYTFRATNNPLLNEGDDASCLALRSKPSQYVPPLQELAARTIIKHGLVSRYPPSLIPGQLKERLKSYQRCSCCGDPFFDYFESDLRFVTVFVFHRLPLYQQICSPHINERCSAVNIRQQYH